MNSKRDMVYLNHIMDSIYWIEKYILNLDYSGFANNHLVQDAVIRQIGIIGEASKNLSKNFTDKYSHIPWKDISGMRDKLIHDYFGVDLEAVWETANKDISSLKKEVGKILRKLADLENKRKFT